MKIVLITPFYRPDNYGGAVQVYENLCRNQDFDFNIICPSSKDETDDDAYFLNSDIKLHRCSSLTFQFTMKSIYSRLQEFLFYRKARKKEILDYLGLMKPDIIINGGVRWLGWMVRDFKKIAPVINYVHGEELSIRPIGIVGKWFFRLQNKSLEQVDLNLCVSSYTSDKVKEISPKAKTAVLTNFVDPNRFFPSDNRYKLKEKYKIDGKVSLISVCRLIERKGIEDLLVAFNEILFNAEEVPNVVLNICGSGPDFKKLKECSDLLGLSEYVSFHGFTEDSHMLELLQASDIFVMPNKMVDGDLEGFGLVFLEANACGLPVIGGRSGGVVDAIEDGVSGFLVTPESNNHLKESLNILIKSEFLRQKIGQQGQQRALSEFSLSKKRSQFITILNEIKEGVEVG